MRRCLPIRLSQTGLLRGTLPEQVTCILDTTGLSKAWWVEVVLTSCHFLSRVPNKNKDETPYEMWIRRNHHFLTCALGDA
jgi:hypothetical protein